METHTKTTQDTTGENFKSNTGHGTQDSSQDPNQVYSAIQGQGDQGK